MVKKVKKPIQNESVVLKTTPTFKLKKEYKMLISNIVDRTSRGSLKKMLIEAQLHDEEATRSGRKGYLEMFKGG